MLDISLGGVFIPAPLVWAGGAFLLSSLIDRTLSHTRFYRLVWHRALFDAAVFVMLWTGISAVAYHLAFSSPTASVAP